MENNNIFDSFRNRLEKVYLISTKPNEYVYYQTNDYYHNRFLWREYFKYTYKAFTSEVFNRLTTCYNSVSFMMYSRLFSYSSYESFYRLPNFVFFHLPDIQQFRILNHLEERLFQCFHDEKIQQRFHVIKSTQEFIFNLNNRFFFSLIEESINFSLFFLAGKFKPA